ncbi:hypothetical protein BDN72DRAFT_841810 [Pluteus cervinus]|uniref:Uncharacterized protein n=1 Tax=Pluteus cervinus TaxID=181527 RepID=A0ACD3ARU0_9AGAR|nr:hypothetical protein BDN72DRAFT_841810 [Pluteus cervinus]
MIMRHSYGAVDLLAAKADQLLKSWRSVCLVQPPTPNPATRTWIRVGRDPRTLLSPLADEDSPSFSRTGSRRRSASESSSLIYSSYLLITLLELAPARCQWIDVVTDSKSNFLTAKYRLDILRKT